MGKYNPYQRLHLVAHSARPTVANVLDVQRVHLEADDGTDMPSPDVLHVKGRALSAVTIEGHWIDIPAEVLKQASDKLTGRTVYKDHRTAAENWVGTVLKSEWADGDIPGIDIEINVDAKGNPKIARGLTWQPNPPIKAFSVGMEIQTKKSHPELDDYDFWVNRGREIDGEIVRSIVDEIIDIYEVSFVWEGADPNALVSDVRTLAKHEEDNVKHITAAISAFVAGDAKAITKLAKHEKAGELEKAVAELVEFLTPKIKDIVPGDAAFAMETTNPIEAAIAEKWRSEQLASITASAAILGETEDSVSVKLAKRLSKAESEDDIATLAELAESMAKRAEKEAPKLVCAKCGSAELERRSSTAGETGNAQHTPDQVAVAGRY